MTALASGAGRVRSRLAAGPGVTFFAVCGLTALGAVIRFVALGHQGLWFDEANTAALVRYSPGHMLGLIPQTESTPPLYYMAAWAWVRVFGYGAADLRSLSALAGVLVIPVAYGAAAELVSRRAGMICAALTACNPFLIWYSQEARSYSSLVLLTGLALLAFARARRDPTPRRLTLWVVAAGLSMATHYFATLAIVPQALLLLAAHPRRRSVQVGVVVAGLCGLGLIPLAISQNGTGNDSWIAHEPLLQRLAQIIPQFLIGTNAPARQPIKFAAFALAAVALALLVVRATASARAARDDRELRGALVAAALAVAGFALALLLIVVGFDDLITRNIIELWLPAAIVVAAGCAAASGIAARIGAAVAVALCAIGLYAAVAIAVTPSMQRPDWPGVARLLGAEPSGGRPRAILIQEYGTLLPLKLYLPGLAQLRGAVRVTELDVITMHSPGQPDCWWGAECNLISSPMQTSYPIAGMHTAWVRHVRQFTIRRLVSARPVTLTRASVGRALTATRIQNDDLMVQPPG
ncbi:MAG TPA: glycosyltransferase family 39 protein [Solirubrobacteraceae bacterium]|nr:glycosyltransferase family 39 protein [Solirubrobacteraceae bacterium]